MNLKAQIDLHKVPRHIAIIMDGNGRWAKEKGEDRLYGHHQGVLSVRDIVEACGEIGVDYLTLYAFSTENWNRPAQEVQGLMELLVVTLAKEVENLHKKNVKLHVIGDMAALPETCQQALQNSMTLTAANTGLNLVLALSYSSRWEITEAARQLAVLVQEQKLKPEDINEKLFEQHLTTAAMPDPELMIRTSGECRISNYLLYQLAYAELYFTPVHWPEFRREHLYKAILDYQNRERRFGKTSEQLQNNEQTA